MEQVKMKYWEMDIWKVNEFDFSNEEVEKFTCKWSQNLVNVRIPIATSSKKLSNIV